jgi:hypothetical protein
MRKHRITDADVAKLFSGHAPQGRPELELLATSLSEFRTASFESVPRPSAALSTRLGVGKPPRVSKTNASLFDVETIETTSPTRDKRSLKGVRTVFTWIAGLGLGLKIALGVAVAAAATTGAGAAGLLPFGTQQAFDEVVSVVIPAEPEDGIDDGVTDEGDVTEGYDPAEGNFGGWVSDQAQDKPGTGQEFGEMVSDEAQNKPHPGATDQSGVEEGDSDESDDDEVNEGVGPQSDHGPAVTKGAR